MGVLCYGLWSILSIIWKRLRLKADYLVAGLGLAILVLDIWSVISVWRYYAG